MVYVLSKEKNPLMPCSNAIGRILLKEKKAKVVMATPFTIQLVGDSTEYKQPLSHGVDSGSAKIGSAVVNAKNEVVYLSEIEIRNDISDKMTQRSKYRRSRRTRNTRYRKVRFLNRKNSIRSNRFSPTMRSKIDSHLKEINFVKSILPITKLRIETATFDAHALKNPEVLKNKWMYQKGINYGFANTKAYVLNRDNYTCQNPKCKCKKVRLEAHHIVFRRNGGSDEATNLITLCKICHDNLHSGFLELKINGKKKSGFSHATQMGSIRIQLIKLLPQAEETFGFITKEHRQLMGLPKEHYFDAVAIASEGNDISFKASEVIFKKCVSDGDYQLRKGVRSERIIPVRKIYGFRKFDKVKYNNENYFIKGRYSTGYVILMDISGGKVDLKPIPKFEKMTRIVARKTWMIDTKKITNQNVGIKTDALISPTLKGRSGFTLC